MSAAISSKCSRTSEEISNTERNISSKFVEDWRLGSELVYFPAVPWITFTGLKHAKSFSKNDSVPRISTGKIFKEGGRIKMPVSLDMHHGLAGGFHAGMFYWLLEETS